MEIKIIQDTEGHFEQGFYAVLNISKQKIQLLNLFQFKKEAQAYANDIKKNGITKVNALKFNGIL